MNKVSDNHTVVIRTSRGVVNCRDKDHTLSDNGLSESRYVPSTDLRPLQTDDQTDYRCDGIYQR